jgi:photosystem II stability/assembly factor-like uncharacterized protein
MKTNFLLTLLIYLSLCGSVACQSKTNSGNSNQSLQLKETPVINLCVNTTPPDNHTSMIDAKKIPLINEFQVIPSGDIWLDTGEISNEIFYLKVTESKWGKLQIGDVKNFSTFNFFGDKNGWAVDYYGDVWKTNDSGTSWNLLYSFKELIEKGDFLQATNINFVSAQTGWLTSTFNDIYQTTDGGQTWRKIEGIPKNSESLKTFFSNEGSWISFRGPAKAIYISTKENSSWKTVKLANNSEYAIPKPLFFVDKTTAFLSTTDGNFFNTKDGGQTWGKFKINTDNIQVNSIFWLDNQNGWIAGSINEKKPFVTKSIDGGKSWENIKMDDIEATPNKIYFVDKQNGWLISRDLVYKTENGGNTWTLFVKLNLSCG